MELKNGIKNFFKKLLEGFLGLIILIGVIYYLSTTDWWNETTDRTERLKIQSDATYRAQVLGSEGVELQSKLSLLIIRRDTTTNEPELKTLNEEIKNTIDEINTRYYRQLAEKARAWHLSVKDYERMNRMRIPQPDGGISAPVELKKEWCYSAYQTAYWETAYSHCKYHAKLNDAKAQYFLGSILENGSGVSKDTRD
jgi:TPR repeat protein